MTSRPAILIVLVCTLLPQLLLSQTVRVEGAAGRWPIVNITPEKAGELALGEAKKEALRLGGVEEVVRSTDALYSRSERSYSQLFSSFSTVEMQGAVVDYAIVDTRQEKDIDGRFYAVVVIDALVKKYSSRPDPQFVLAVAGLEAGGYKAGDAVRFSVTPAQEGFLKIFLVEDSQKASQLFPNPKEPDRKFAAGARVFFPTNRTIRYTAEKSSAGKVEHNYLVLVYTKDNIPWSGETTYENLLKWINAIEPSGRCVVFEEIIIL